jgi:hypothetical protein
VADDDDAEISLAKPADQLQDLLGLCDAQRGGRLVEEHDLGVAQQRSGDGDRLALSAGEAADLRADAAEGGHGKLVEQLQRALLHGGLVEGVHRDRDAAVVTGDLLLTEEEVGDHVEVVAKGEVLEDGGDAELPGRLRRRHLDLLAFEEHLAALCGLHAVHRLDQRGLAGAVVADQRDDLAAVNLEVDVGQRLDGAEALGDPPQREERHGFLHLFFLSSRHGYQGVSLLVSSTSTVPPPRRPARSRRRRCPRRSRNHP